MPDLFLALGEFADSLAKLLEGLQAQRDRRHKNSRSARNRRKVMAIDFPATGLLSWFHCQRAAGLIIRIVAVYALFQLAGAAQAQTTAGSSKFYYCGREVSLTTGIIAADGNSIAALYQFEFSTSADFTPVLLVVDASRGESPAFVKYPQFRYATTYYVRVSVKYNNTSEPWSAPGPACSFTTIPIRYYHCGREISLTTGIIAADSNSIAARYRFEFSTSSDFTPILLAVDVARGESPAFVKYPQFRYATTYYVRISVKYNDDTSEPWSAPGPACSFTTIACQTPLQVSAKNTSSVCEVNGAARVFVSGGIPPYTYAWSPGGGTLPTIEGLPSGVYTAKVEDARGCTGNAQVVIHSSASPLSLCIKTRDATCANNDGTATVTAEGGIPPYSYTWSMTPPQQTPAVAALSEGVYTITVADANGCIRKVTVVIGRGTCAQ
jgi:hypothetical protein